MSEMNGRGSRRRRRRRKNWGLDGAQLTLDRARRLVGTRGGWRPGAGRPKLAGTISHQTRPAMPPRFPEHVVLRFHEDVPPLDRTWLVSRLRNAIAASHKPFFRVCHFNVQSNHLHLIVEASNKESLARGMIGLTTRIAKRLNKAFRRRGKVFAHRYYVRALKTPTEVRNCLRYVLLNRKHHAPSELKFDSYWFDPYSSAAWFDGWEKPPRPHGGWQRELVELPTPTAPPATWLLAKGWLRAGPKLELCDRPS
jgi:REP element-mobilizing transposase RayT